MDSRATYYVVHTCPYGESLCARDLLILVFQQTHNGNYTLQNFCGARIPSCLFLLLYFNRRKKGFVRYIIEIKAQKSAVRYVMEFPKSRRALKSYNKKKQFKVKNHITPETKLILLNLIFCYL